jgi:hypothetical protein
VPGVGGVAVTDNVETRFGPRRRDVIHTRDCWERHPECAYLLGWADCKADDAAVQAAIERIRCGRPTPTDEVHNPNPLLCSRCCRPMSKHDEMAHCESTPGAALGRLRGSL